MSVKGADEQAWRGTIGGIRSLVGTESPVLRRRIELRYTSTVRRLRRAESGRITVRNMYSPCRSTLVS